MGLTLKVSFARVMKSGEVNTLGITNKWLKEYRKIWMLEVIYYFNNCLEIVWKIESKPLTKCLDQLWFVIVDGGNPSGVRGATLAWYTCSYWVWIGNHT